MYNEKVMEHFQNPKNMGDMKNPDATGRVGNVVCGDLMHIHIKVGKDKEGDEIIEDIKYQTFGCVAAISTSSMVTELAKGKKIKEALKIDKEAIANELGGLPQIKYHCSILAADALAEAIYEYLRKNKREIPENLKKRHKKIKKDREIVEKKQQK